MHQFLRFISFILLSSSAQAQNPLSQCFGTPAAGHLQDGWKLPTRGNNFSAYSATGALLGRTYVHSSVYAVVLDAYKTLENSATGKHFTYGETGFELGGPFKPHKSHQNGLSVDFFVPVINQQGVSAELPINPLNKFGYDIEFDSHGYFKNLHIDFETMARHLAAIKKAAETHGVGIRVVIFDNQFQPLLLATPTGKTLIKQLTFSIKKPWVRHDEHYHIDFIIPCKN